MPEVVIDQGWVLRRVGATLVACGVLSLVAAVVHEGEFTEGHAGGFLGIDHPVTFLLCVLALLFWVNGAVLWWCGVKVRPAAASEHGRSDYDPV